MHSAPTNEYLDKTDALTNPRHIQSGQENWSTNNKFAPNRDY